MGDVIPIVKPAQLRVKDRGRVCRAIVMGEDFDAGNLHGKRIHTEALIDGKRADYEVSSYSTTLALHVPAQRYRQWDDEYQHDVVMNCDDHWVVFNVEGYSKTTERHSEIVRGALVVAKVVER